MAHNTIWGGIPPMVTPFRRGWAGRLREHRGGAYAIAEEMRRIVGWTVAEVGGRRCRCMCSGRLMIRWCGTSGPLRMGRGCR